MDLLNENQNQQPKAFKGKKMIIGLLILSVIAFIIVLIIMLYVESNKELEYTLFINAEQKEISENLLISDTQGIQYISLNKLAELLDYDYYNSEYNNYSVDTAKGYIKNNKLITGFELGSNEIYKYEEDTNLDYQYYQLEHSIIIYNNNLYVALVDLSKVLNVYFDITNNKEILINTMEYMTQTYQEKLKEKGYTISSEQNNQKALSYGWIIASKNGVWSVLNFNFEEIIESKYSSIYFDEYNLNYIVSNTNKQYGIINKTGIVEQALKYDGLEVLNYENDLYKVKYNEKYGIMKKNGSMLTGIIYDDIGYPKDSQNKILYTLLIPEMDGRSGQTIVVKQNNFYGLITLENGDVYLPTDHVEKLYSISELGNIYYKIEAEKQTMDLLDYLKQRNLVTIKLN